MYHRVKFIALIHGEKVKNELQFSKDRYRQIVATVSLNLRFVDYVCNRSNCFYYYVKYFNILLDLSLSV